jgi:hypothetical protein
LLQILRNFPQIKNQRPEGQHAIEREGRGRALLAKPGKIGIVVADCFVAVG